MCRGTLGEFQDWSWYSQAGLGCVGGPTGRSETGRGTVAEELDGSGDARVGPARVGEHSPCTGTG